MFLIECPHCKNILEILQLNCGIFRHAVFKHNHNQIDPHTSKEECERLIAENIIYGCGKPFQISVMNGEISIEICDYI